MKLLSLLLISLTLISCNQSEVRHTQTHSVNIDSLTNLFLDAWNTHDSSAIMQTISENAVVMNDSVIHKGSKAIAQNWISGGVKVLSNIQTSSVVKDNDAKIAFNGGTYSLDLNPPGSPVLKEKGNYNLVWIKQNNGEWKLILIHIEDITRMPDIK